MNKENVIKPNIIMEKSEINQTLIRILKGSIVSIIVSLILLLIFAMLLTYTQLSETTVVPVVMAIVGISILIGSTISSRKIKKNGLLNGAIVGLVYIITLYLTSSLCFAGFSLTANSFILLIIGIFTGMVGGIIGVNA